MNPAHPPRRKPLTLLVLAAMSLLGLAFPAGADDTHPPILPDNGGTTNAPDSGTPSIPLPPPNPPPPVEQENGKPIFGAFNGNKVESVEQYEQWLGRPTDGILGYTGDASWADYEGSVGWSMHALWRHIDRRVLWSVSLIPKGATLAEAAKGTYNDHWRKIAEKLAAWHPDEKVLYIRTGWEFNGGWFHYNAVHKADAFIGAWRQFVSVFRSVSPRFRFDWCPAGAAWMPMKAEDAYPGDDYVDIIGLDIYDQEKWCKIKDPKQRWEQVYLKGNHGLLWHQKFAQEHHKPMSYPEWGAGGVDSGDNPYFIEQMHQWFLDNHVIYATYWNSNSSYKGQLSNDQYPNMGAKYKELFGTADSANPAPPAPIPIAGEPPPPPPAASTNAPAATPPAAPPTPPPAPTNAAPTNQGASSATTPANGPAISTTNEGVKVVVPGMAPFTLSYPILAGEKITGTQADGTTAKVTYDGGTTIAVRIAGHGTVNYHLTGLPPTVKKVEMQLPLDPSYANGGVFRADDANTVPFPAAIPAHPILLGHNQNRLAVHDGSQRSLVMHLPGHSYLQIEDWRGKTPSDFVARIISPIMSPDMSLHVGDPPATRSAANQPPITIPHITKAIAIDGKTEAWAGMPAWPLDATREVGGQDGSSLHAPSWKVPASLEGKAADASATFRLGWDEKNLYVLVDVTDPTPLHNLNPANRLWGGDAVELFFGVEALEQDGDLLPTDRQVTLGADATLGSRTYVRGVGSQPSFSSLALPRPGGYLVEAAIPLGVLGLSPVAGRKIRFDLGLDDSIDGKNRHAQLMWNGTNQNSNERTNWGWATLGS
jgi:hypothetical protein